MISNINILAWGDPLMQGFYHHVQFSVATMSSHSVFNVLHAIFQALSTLQKPLDPLFAVFMESLGS